MNQLDDIELKDYLAISRAVAGELEFQSVLNRIAGAVKSKLFDYDHLDIAVLNPIDKSKHVAFETGVDTIWGQIRKTQKNDMSPIRQVLSGEVEFMVTGDAWEDPRFHFEGAFDAPIFEANLRSRIHVALMVHGEVLGAFNISSHSKNIYDEGHVEIARNIADLISPYIYASNMAEQARVSALAEGAARGRENSLRIGAQKLTDAMEAERQRLGMELHDQTLADMSAIYRRITRQSNSTKPDMRELKLISAAISRCTDELRGIIENAKPGVLELLGLSQAIEAQLTRSTLGLNREISTSFTDSTDDYLDQGAYRIRLAIFRIVQEAVTNAVKHSACSNISVSLSLVDDQFRIAVVNDGKAPSEGWRQSPRGVDNIRVRAALIGASVSFERNEDEKGSQTVLTLPFSSVLGQTSDEALEEASPTIFQRAAAIKQTANSLSKDNE